MKPKRFSKKYWSHLWLQFDSPSAILHRAAQDVKENRNSKSVVRNFTGSTVCGKSGLLFFPGVFSRMGAKRCKACCKIVGVPEGNGNPFNHDIRETRPASK